MIQLRPRHIHFITLLSAGSQNPPSSVQRRLPSLIRTALSQSRTFAQRQAFSTKTSKVKDAVHRKAAAAANAEKAQDYTKPLERLLIYHAGTGRITFLAVLRLTSIFVGAFFFFIATPAYIKEDKPALQTAVVALCGLVPILFITFTTSPFVTHIHIHLPRSAVLTPAHLRAYIRDRPLPPATQLTFTTMSLIGKPRYSAVAARDLRPARGGQRRLGLVNYTRDTGRENVGRRWWEFRAVGKFYVQEEAAGDMAARGRNSSERYKDKKGLVEGWVWDDIKWLVEKRSKGQERVSEAGH